MPEEKLCISTKPPKNIIYFCSDLLTSSSAIPVPSPLSPCLFLLLAKLFVGEKVKNFRIHSKKCRYFWINQSRHLLLVKMTNDKEQRFPSKVKLILVSVNFWGHGLDACVYMSLCDPLIRPAPPTFCSFFSPLFWKNPSSSSSSPLENVCFET